MMARWFAFALLLGACVAQDAKAQPNRGGGLPGITPIKKATAATKATPTTAAPTGAPPPYSQYRLKLQAAYCPTASAEDKDSTACKSYAISAKMKKASAEEKKPLVSPAPATQEVRCSIEKAPVLRPSVKS